MPRLEPADIGAARIQLAVLRCRLRRASEVITDLLGLTLEVQEQLAAIEAANLHP